MDGTVVEEKIIHAAGAATDQIFHRQTIVDMIREAGRIPMERDTLYETPQLV
jgi:aminodeoxyfutalosine synthase